MQQFPHVWNDFQRTFPGIQKIDDPQRALLKRWLDFEFVYNAAPFLKQKFESFFRHPYPTTEQEEQYLTQQFDKLLTNQLQPLESRQRNSKDPFTDWSAVKEYSQEIRNMWDESLRLLPPSWRKLPLTMPNFLRVTQTARTMYKSNDQGSPQVLPSKQATRRQFDEYQELVTKQKIRQNLMNLNNPMTLKQLNQHEYQLRQGDQVYGYAREKTSEQYKKHIHQEFQDYIAHYNLNKARYERERQETERKAFAAVKNITLSQLNEMVRKEKEKEEINKQREEFHQQQQKDKEKQRQQEQQKRDTDKELFRPRESETPKQKSPPKPLRRSSRKTLHSNVTSAPKIKSNSRKRL